MKRFHFFILTILILTSCAKIKLQKHSQLNTNPSDWGMYGRNPGRTNEYPGSISLPLKLKWHLNASAAIERTILVRDSVIFFSTMDGRIYAYNIETRKKIGYIKTEYNATGVVKDSALFVARRYGDETLVKYCLMRGKKEWEFNAGDITTEPLILDDGIVVTALYKHIDFYDLTNGESIWKFETNKQIRSSPACDGEIIVFGCDDGNIYAIKKSTGELKWEYKTAGSVQVTPAIKNDVVYVGSNDKKFYAINLQTGRLVWEFQTNGQIFHAAGVTDSIVVFGSTDSFLYCLNRISGKLIWTFEAKSVISTSPLICEDKIFIGSLDHHLYALDRSTGVELWKFKAKGRIRSNPIIYKNYLILASEDDELYVFESNKQE